MGRPGNYNFQMVDTREEAFGHAIEIVFDENKTAEFWFQTKDNWLELYSYKPAGADHLCRLPYKMNAEQCIAFAWGWLQSQDSPSTKHISHDGSTSPTAFEIQSKWDFGVICRIRKEWALYYK